MPEINLLSGEAKPTHSSWAVVVGTVVKILWVVLILVAAGWAYYWYMNDAEGKKIVETQNETAATYDSLVNSPERKELVARQGQLKAFASIIKTQPHWSSFFVNKLAPATLKSSHYVSVNAQKNGTLRMTVSVPTYSDLDKFLQVFDSPDINKTFNDIKVTSLSKGQNEDVVDIRFEVTMKYNPETALAKPAADAATNTLLPTTAPTTNTFTR